MYFKVYYNLNEFYENNIQMPTWLIKVEPFKSLSSNAKLLYVLLRQRMAYSINNGYFEPDGTPYVIFTRNDMCEILNLSNKTAVAVVKELVNIGLISERHLGLNQANHIYVKYPMLEEGGNCSPKPDNNDNNLSDTCDKTGSFDSNTNSCTPDNTSYSGDRSVNDMDNVGGNHTTLDEEKLHGNIIKRNIFKDSKYNYIDIDNYDEDSTSTNHLIRNQKYSSLNNNMISESLLKNPELQKYTEIFDKSIDRSNSLYDYNDVVLQYLRYSEAYRSESYALKALDLFDSVVKSFKGKFKSKILSASSDLIASLYQKAFCLVSGDRSYVDNQRAYLARSMMNALEMAC